MNRETPGVRAAAVPRAVSLGALAAFVRAAGGQSWRADVRDPSLLPGVTATMARASSSMERAPR